MNHRIGRLFGVSLMAAVLVSALVPALSASATSGVMQINADTTLTEDHAGQIVINADNVTLDCAGHRVTGAAAGSGIELQNRTGATVRNCDVSGFRNGIYLGDSSGNTVEKNHVHDNTLGDLPAGIAVWGSSGNTISNNTATDNGSEGIIVGTDSDGNTVVGNTATGNGRNGFFFWQNNNTTVTNNEARSNKEHGFVVGRSSGNTVTANTSDQNVLSGFSVTSSDDNTLGDNSATGNGDYGFLVAEGDNTDLTGNSATANGVDGFLSDGTGGTVSGNESHRNGEVGFRNSGVKTYSENSCTGNLVAGSAPFGLCQEEQVGLVDPATGEWHLRHSANQVASFYYGNPGDVPFMGNWNCGDTATPGLFRTSDAYAYLRNSNTQGIADIRFFYGNPSDIPLAGDFNGDGCDTLSIYRPSEARFYIINKLGENEGGLGAAEYSFIFGNPGDKPVVGDWDGDGIDEVGLHRESTGFFYYRNTLTTGIADGQFFFGDPGDRFVSGDWGIVDGAETPALFRPSDTTFYFRYTLTQGNADAQFVWRGAGSDWLPVSGDFKLEMNDVTGG